MTAACCAPEYAELVSCVVVPLGQLWQVLLLSVGA
jgi:hypothetical protein